MEDNRPVRFRPLLVLVGVDAWGYEVTGVPSADDRIEDCQRQMGQAQIQCWAELDTWLMEKVVPAIPLDEVSSVRVTSRRVVGYPFDASTGNPALDRISLVPDSE